MTSEFFWETALLYLNRPNLINRRYIGAQCLKSWRVPLDKTKETIESGDVWRKFSISSIVERFELQELSFSLALNDVISSNQVFIVLRKLFRKQSLKSLQLRQQESDDTEYDIFIFYPTVGRFSIIPVQCTESEQEYSLHEEQFSYAMKLLEDDKLGVEFLFASDNNSTRTTYWLENILKPKLESWIRMSRESAKAPLCDENQIRGSITKISLDTYCANYNRLKAKYSVELLGIWKTLEKTDPLKFIFEDIAIASYLLTLWSDERERLGLTELQSFADIGCGNGLLVYILAREGHPGCGIDVRKRTIWDHFEGANLIEQQIDPQDPESVAKLPEVDWMIGNHSDELTPWILYLASRASSKMRVFILPCCPFDFDGLKFQRTTEASKSQYQGYMDYLQELATKFGFRNWRDKLRIPSTKRTCIVGYDRQFSSPDLNFTNVTGERARESLKEFADVREEFVQERLKSRTQTMRLRQAEIVVRNCSKIDDDVREKMINRIVELLYKLEKVTFKQVLSHFRDPDILAAMKNQCGGIQTFVRNHKHIFTIRDSFIQFQKPDALRIPSGQEHREKNRPCWFRLNHPSGCPLSDQDCRYKHP